MIYNYKGIWNKEGELSPSNQKTKTTHILVLSLDILSFFFILDIFLSIFLSILWSILLILPVSADDKWTVEACTLTAKKAAITEAITAFERIDFILLFLVFTNGFLNIYPLVGPLA